MKSSKLKRMGNLIREGKFCKEMIAHTKHKFEKRQEKLIPAVPITDIVSAGVKPNILDSSEVDDDGNVTPLELESICKVINHYRPKSMLEIGTFDGMTTLHLSMNADDDAEIYTLDLPREKINETALRVKTGEKTFIDKDTPGRQFLKREEHAKRITQLLGDSAAFDFSFYESKLDFVFVDGSHSYEYVYNDTEVALKLMRDGKGIIMWHDYGWREVVQALNEIYTENEVLKNAKNIENTSLVFLKLG
ncbi:MAG: class I SAM-dependent methyltransferase [SAR324 cluster bacterium]|jgi:predicted O-methyltransferase YrrM|nr:class I SAM-dependent methyltransferase [SAR324 cluster bacterium]|tara:strand:- start:287 stop:1030 length:744 start_codon:yes stop_codon:yes gene_type:complete